METKVTEIAPDVYRISTFHPNYGIQFNQFLIKDDEPFLMHTGFKKSFSNTLEGVSSVIDPSKLRWIGYSHFEPDECGALNEWLGIAPRAQAVCSFVGAMVCLNDFADREARAWRRRGAGNWPPSLTLPGDASRPAWMGRGVFLRGE
jgi:flavorubredoxin